MTAQDLIIYGIVRKRLYEFLKPKYIDFFSGTTAKLYEACFMLKMRKLDPSVEYITNYIHQSNEIKDKKETVQHLKDITDGDKHVDVLSLPNILEHEWYTGRFSELVNTLVDKNSTLEIKKDLVHRTNAVINRTTKQDDFKSVKDILKEFNENKDNNTVKNFKESLIHLQDGNLKRIFDDTIYPQMYSILARPNDFKTTLLMNLILEFSNIDKPGILVTLEDSSTMAAFKVFSLVSGIKNKQIVQHEYNNETYIDGLEKMKDNIFVMDRMRTSDQVFVDLDNKLSVSDRYKWVAIDYMQCIKGEKYLSEYEKINLLDRQLFEINKKYNIPVFRLSQAPKDKIQSGSMLGMGDEKGSGEISHNSRYSLSINKMKLEDDNEQKDITRRVNVYKTTFCPKKEMDVVFNGATGKLVGVYNI